MSTLRHLLRARALGALLTAITVAAAGWVAGTACVMNGVVMRDCHCHTDRADANAFSRESCCDALEGAESTPMIGVEAPERPAPPVPVPVTFATLPDPVPATGLVDGTDRARDPPAGADLLIRIQSFLI